MFNRGFDGFGVKIQWKPMVFDGFCYVKYVKMNFTRWEARFGIFRPFGNIFFRRFLTTRSKVMIKFTFFIENHVISIALVYIRIPIVIQAESKCRISDENHKNYHQFWMSCWISPEKYIFKFTKVAKSRFPSDENQNSWFYIMKTIKNRWFT